MQVFHQGVNGIALLLESLPTEIVDQSDPAAERREPDVGIVLPKQDPILGAGREHPIRFVHPLGNQIIDQDTDVSLITA